MHPILWTVFLLCLSPPALAQERSASPSFMGPLGLNLVPSARMDAAGTVRAGVATFDPYLNSYLSFQPAEWMNVTLRQSGEVSSLRDDARFLYPGVDLKFRLREESRYYPEIALGLIGATGHRRMAGEYLALSKRYYDFDFTGGIGWGRMGSAGTIRNPLSFLGGRFDRERALDGMGGNDDSSGPKDWFSGRDAALFAGVEYHTPVEGLSLKFDYGGDRFRAERTAFDFSAPAPWSVGINYAPTPWLDMSLGTAGGDKVMAGLSLKTGFSGWTKSLIGRDRRDHQAPALSPERPDKTTPAKMIVDAAQHSAIAMHHIRSAGHSLRARFESAPHTPIPQQIGRAARHIANNADAAVEDFYITPEIYGLHGGAIKIMRGDMERAILRHQGSPQEIWRNAALHTTPPETLDGEAEGKKAKSHNIRFILDLKTSVSEADHSLLYRTAGIIDYTVKRRGNWWGRAGVRLNGPHNLDHLNAVRPRAFFPVRGDEDQFARQRIAVDTLHESWLKSSPSGEWHYMASLGYLEEMYAGYGGEVLYRPHGRTWALGVEGWWALKRDPDSFMNLGLNGDHLLTGHIKGWYEIPRTDLTLGLKAGRYLAEDVGATLSLNKFMSGGAHFEAFATATGDADINPFGGRTHLYSGIKLTLPIGAGRVIPGGSHIRAAALPLGRDSGQAINNPMPLYELTEPFSTRALIRDWGRITD